MNKSTRVVAQDDQLQITYSIRHQDQVLETSAPGESVAYKMGEGQWPIQIELAMLGEEAGKQLALQYIAGDNVFGCTDPERIVTMDAVDFEPEPEPGQLIEFKLEKGEVIEGQILSVFADKIEVDFNHPYAGRDLTILIQIVSIL
jgi:FKBP-type peptidyl-prolyl cis-trans isomerase 2